MAKSIKKFIIYSGIFLVLISCKIKTRQSKLFPSEDRVSLQMDSILKESDLRGLVATAVNKKGEKIEAHADFFIK